MRLATITLAIAAFLLATGAAFALKCRGSKVAVEQCLLEARSHTYELTNCVWIGLYTQRCKARRRPHIDPLRDIPF